MSKMCMEEVHSIALEAMKTIEKRLKAHGVKMTDEQEDSIYVPMSEAIEKICGYPDYASHN